MFTEFIRKSDWNYMFLAVVATLAVAALVTLASTRNDAQSQSRAKQDNGQVITGRNQQNYETTMRFVN